MRLQGTTNVTPAVWQAALALFCWALLCALLCTGVAKVLIAVNGYHVVHLLPIFAPLPAARAPCVVKLC